MSVKSTGIVWFRNDLRLEDNEAICNALAKCQIVHFVYVFDDSFLKAISPSGFRRTGYFRTKFLLETVENLRSNLEAKGATLIVRTGKPEEVIPNLARQTQANFIFCNREMTPQEIRIQDNLEQNLWPLGAEIVYSRGKMLYYTSDLPFPILHTPETFSQFRKEVEKLVPVRNPLPAPNKLSQVSFSQLDPGPMPTMEEFGFIQKEQVESRFKGGEDAAMEQLHYFIWEEDFLSHYKDNRNGLLGWDYSSKFSPWLALGALSPKTIYDELKKYEVRSGENEGSYWLFFELLWRDYFRLMGKKHGSALFKMGGLQNKVMQYIDQPELLEAWTKGETGNPFIDANMKELNATGYMSNRGRQVTASYLIKDLGLNWLSGAEYFESMLIDYDPCSNYCNWAYLAGVGNDPREDRYFNVLSQARKYDPKGEFVKKWLPVLYHLPEDQVHAPELVSREMLALHGVVLGNNYPKPLIHSDKWLV